MPRRLDKIQVLLQEFKLDNVMAQSISTRAPLSQFNNCGRIQRFKKRCVRVHVRVRVHVCVHVVLWADRFAVFVYIAFLLLLF